jgi:hypothetical protein
MLAQKGPCFAPMIKIRVCCAAGRTDACRRVEDICQAGSYFLMERNLAYFDTDETPNSLQVIGEAGHLNNMQLILDRMS